MYFRLYFLLPDTVSVARKVIDELNQMGIDNKHIHTHTRDSLQTQALPPETPHQHMDWLASIEKLAWNSDLVIFFIALAVFIVSLVTGSVPWMIMSLLVMAFCFIAGNLFATYVPRVHLGEFTDALAHNEILLMVDVKRHQLAAVDRLVERHHPAAVPGGSSWTIDALGI